jgi:hypothetical protein
MVGNFIAHNCQYGAGAGKVQATLENDGIFLSEYEVREIWDTYWRTFDGLKAFGKSLEREWVRNGGYILNGTGRPMCVPEDYKKDLLNRFIQSTGHDLLTQYILIYTHELTVRGIPWRPLILDFHDASCVEVPIEYADQTVEVFNWGVTELNRQLGWDSVKLRGTPDIGTTLADVKSPEE